jgi:hypothetical protein
LDLFDDETLQAAGTLWAEGDAGASTATANKMPKAKPSVAISEDILNAIVEKVLRRMSSDTIREVAWEVVPELSENIIRRTIEEQNKA